MLVQTGFNRFKLEVGKKFPFNRNSEQNKVTAFKNTSLHLKILGWVLQQSRWTEQNGERCPLSSLHMPVLAVQQFLIKPPWMETGYRTALFGGWLGKAFLSDVDPITGQNKKSDQDVDGIMAHMTDMCTYQISCSNCWRTLHHICAICTYICIVHSTCR